MMHRRQVISGLAALALPACRGGAPRVDAQDPRWRELRFEPGADSPREQRALLLAPDGAPGLPVLVALHGRGESVRGVEVGARGWRDDYHLDRMLGRLRAPPLTANDLGGFVEPARLARMNASLQAAPFGEMVVATPYTPEPTDRSLEGGRLFGRFVVERLLPRVRGEVGGEVPRARVGIDGVSLGGRLALLVGLAHPEVFGAVGALQPAIRSGEAPAFAALAKEATRKAPLLLRLVSSEGDPFLPEIRALSAELAKQGVAHDLFVGPGPHDYGWNRGPGGAEMLLWHERVQRGLPPP